MSAFIAQQITRSHTIHLPATPSEVFPLFSPLGEKHWAHGWDPEMLSPSSGEAQVGSVFTTQHANKPTQIWTIIAYASEQAQVSYLNVLPDSHVSRIEVSCEAEGTQATLARITYTLTALTSQGNTYLDEFTQEYYQDYISSWETAITHYLLHGHMLAHPEA
jgi:hypothetical protein